jgi:hypothetical protein
VMPRTTAKMTSASTLTAAMIAMLMHRPSGS